MGALALLMMASGAWAAPVTWTVDATFVIGDLYGTFDYDADTDVYTNIFVAIDSTDGILHNSTFYDAYGYQDGVDLEGITGTGGYRLDANLRFATSLTSSGGTVALGPGSYVHFWPLDSYWELATHCLKKTGNR